MSADNIIYIQQRLNGLCYTWHDFASNENPAPGKEVYGWSSHEAAHAYACGLYDGYGYVEYGVCQLEPEQEKQQEFTLPANFSKVALCCPACDHVLHIELKARQQVE